MVPQDPWSGKLRGVRLVSWLRRKVHVAAVAQSVRAPGCGPGGRGFDSRRSPFSSYNDERAEPYSRATQLVSSASGL